MADQYKLKIGAGLPIDVGTVVTITVTSAVYAKANNPQYGDEVKLIGTREGNTCHVYLGYERHFFALCDKGILARGQEEVRSDFQLTEPSVELDIWKENVDGASQPAWKYKRSDGTTAIVTPAQRVAKTVSDEAPKPEKKKATTEERQRTLVLSVGRVREVARIVLDVADVLASERADEPDVVEAAGQIFAGMFPAALGYLAPVTRVGDREHVREGLATLNKARKKGAQ